MQVGGKKKGAVEGEWYATPEEAMAAAMAKQQQETEVAATVATPAADSEPPAPSQDTMPGVFTKSFTHSLSLSFLRDRGFKGHE